MLDSGWVKIITMCYVSSFKQVVTEAQMVLIGLQATSKFYSFYWRFMMSAARLTAGMLTESYQWQFCLEGRDRNMLTRPCAKAGDLVVKIVQVG